MTVTWKVEVAFDAPFEKPPSLLSAMWSDSTATWGDSDVGWSGGPDWTDITSDTMGLRIQRGRRRRFQRMESASVSITLSNNDRKYDPLNSDSPHASGLVPHVPVRVSVNRDGTNTILFVGYVIEWPSTLLPKRDHRQTIEATDGFALLSRWEVTGALSAGATGNRVNEILDLAGWPADLRDVDGGNARVVARDVDDEKALSLLSDTAIDEDGTFYMDNEGRAAFRQRHTRVPYHSPIKFTLDTDGAYAPNRGSGDSTGRYFANRVEVDWDGGTRTAENKDSQSKYGKRSDNVTTRLDSEPQAKDRAEYKLDRGASPRTIISDVILHAKGNTALWDVIEGTRINDRVDVILRPTTGSAVSQESFLEGVEIDASPGDWTFTFALSEAETRSFWIVGISKLDTGTRLGF